MISSMKGPEAEETKEGVRETAEGVKKVSVKIPEDTAMDTEEIT